MGNEDQILVTLSDLEMIRQVAVLVDRTDRNEKVNTEIFAQLKATSAALTNIQTQIADRNDRLERDMKDYVHEKFVTTETFKVFEAKLDSKMSKSTWIISGFVSAGALVTWLSVNTTIFGG